MLWVRMVFTPIPLSRIGYQHLEKLLIFPFWSREKNVSPHRFFLALSRQSQLLQSICQYFILDFTVLLSFHSVMKLAWEALESVKSKWERRDQSYETFFWRRGKALIEFGRNEKRVELLNLSEVWCAEVDHFSNREGQLLLQGTNIK